MGLLRVVTLQQNLKLPAIMCRVLLINLHLSEIDSFPYYHFLLSQNTPCPADLPCIKLIAEQLPSTSNKTLPAIKFIVFIWNKRKYHQLTENFQVWTSKGLGQTFYRERLHQTNAANYSYQLVNEKTVHRRLMRIVGRANDRNCQHCVSFIRKTTTIIGGWQRPKFNNLLRPVLDRIHANYQIQNVEYVNEIHPLY